MKTNDKTTATPSTTNTTNGIARNPPFVALRKPLSPYFAYGLIPGSSKFHSGMFTGVGLGLSSVPRKRARRTFEYAERRSSQNLPSTRWWISFRSIRLTPPGGIMDVVAEPLMKNGPPA
jgi:hypothetical protein